jgi:hypothetical protein
MKGHWRSMQCPHECVCICVDYVITLLLSLCFHYILCASMCMCVSLLCCPSHLRVDVGRVSQYEEKKPEKKKVSLVRHCVDSQCVQDTGRLVCCVCVRVYCRRHRRPKDIGCSKGKKGEKTETDMQSKAIEGVPVVHMRLVTLHVLDISLSLSFFGRVGRTFPFSLALIRLMLI